MIYGVLTLAFIVGASFFFYYYRVVSLSRIKEAHAFFQADTRMYDVFHTLSDNSGNNKYLYDLGLGRYYTSTAQEKIYSTPRFLGVKKANTGYAFVFESPPEIGLSEWKQAEKTLRYDLELPQLSVVEETPGSCAVLSNTEDPFRISKEFLPADPRSLSTKRSMIAGIRADGSIAYFPLRDNAGCVIGGTWGNNMCRSVMYSLSSMIGKAELHIIDALGNNDYAPLAPYTMYYSPSTEVDSLSFTICYIRLLFSLRVRYLYTLYRENSFWNAPHSKGLVPVIITIDCCDKFFRKIHEDSPDNDSIDLNIANIEYLVTQGRSAGIFFVFVTHTPTNHSLPPIIRDACGSRAAFKLPQSTSVTGIFGRSLQGVCDPLTIRDDQQGLCVLSDSTGGTVDYVQTGNFTGIAAEPVGDRSQNAVTKVFEEFIKVRMPFREYDDLAREYVDLLRGTALYKEFPFPWDSLHEEQT